MLKPLVLAFAPALAAPAALAAQAHPWQPAPGHTQVPIWPGTPPDAQPVAGPEQAVTRLNDHLVAGRPWTYVGPVARPTMTVYAPKGGNTGAAAVVFPGGGYEILAIDLEGTEVCDWLTSRGITCVLLKYRVPGGGGKPKSGAYPSSPMALEDAQRTIGLVRLHAAEWHIDPHRIGVLGFSAGGHLVAAISTHFDKRLYAPVDVADSVSCRPDFAVALYPGHMLEPPPLPAVGGATDCRRMRSGSSSTGTEVRTTLGARELLDFYARQLRDAGWTRTSGESAGASWTRAGEEGDTMFVALVVSAGTGPRASCHSVNLEISTK